MRSAYTNFLHISDLHFRAPSDPEYDDSLSPQSLVRIIEELLARNSFRPKCIVASGDFTTTCQHEEFAQARTFLRLLSNSMGLDRSALVVVPGNHDVNWSEQAKSRLAGFSGYENFFHSVRPQYDSDGTSWFTCQWHDGNIFVLGLNSCLIEAKNTHGVGYVDPDQLRDAKEQYATLWSSCATRIAVLHHHVVPVAYNSYDPTRVPDGSIVLNTEQVISWLLENRFDLVLHGHKHVPFFAGEKRYLRERESSASDEAELIVIAAGSAGASLKDIGEVRQRSLNLLEVNESEVRIRSLTYGEGRPDIYRHGSIPFTKRPHSPTVASLLRILQKQYTDLASSAASVPIGPDKSILFKVDGQHLLTLAPAIYALGGNRVLATSFMPVDFWTSKIGELFLEATARAEQLHVRRLFVAPMKTAQLLRVMNEQARKSVQPRFLSLRTYFELIKDAVVEVRGLLLRLGISELSLNALDTAPERLALAVYGDPGRGDAFLGFDFSSDIESMVALVFEPPPSVIQNVARALEVAWTRASTLHGLQERDDRTSVYLFGVHRWNRSYVIRECLEAGLRVIIATTVGDRVQPGIDLLTMAHGYEAVPDDPVVLAQMTAAGNFTRTGLGDVFALALDDYVAQHASGISAEPGVQCFPTEAARTVARKHELRDLWNAFVATDPIHLRSVEYAYLSFSEVDKSLSVDQNVGWFDALGSESDVIVKPDELSASIEIHAAKGRDHAIKTAGRVCDRLIERWRVAGAQYGIPIRPRIIVEECIPRSESLHRGAEFSVEFISFDSRHTMIGVTQKWTGPNFIETGHLFPAQTLPFRLVEPLREAVNSLLTTLRVRYCVSHWEFIVTRDERIALVEGHLRPAGDRIMELIERSTGNSPTGVLCRAIAGGAVNQDSFRVGLQSSIFWLVPERPLEKVDYIQVDWEAFDRKSVRLVLDEDTIRSATNWSCASDWTLRPAAVLASGNSLTELRAISQAVANAITIATNGANGNPAQKSRLKLAVDL